MNETNNLKLNKPEKTDFVSIGDFNENSDKIDALGAPEFDDSGTVNGITDFTTYLSTLVSGTSVFNFFRNLKAGFQYVLHVGQLVNNTVTNNDNLPAAASAVYKLQQSFNSTNSKIGNTSNLPSGINDLVSAILQTNSNLNTLTGQYPLIYKGVFYGNLNTFPAPGYYTLGAAGEFQGAPENTQYTGLIQFPESMFYTQIITDAGPDGGVKTRRFIGNPQSWTEWI